MIRYFVIYTFLIAYGHNKIKTETYAHIFTDRQKAQVEFKSYNDECVSDTAEWRFITKQDMKSGIIIMVELDSLSGTSLIKIDSSNKSK